MLKLNDINWKKYLPGLTVMFAISTEKLHGLLNAGNVWETSGKFLSHGSVMKMNSAEWFNEHYQPARL